MSIPLGCKFRLGFSRVKLPSTARNLYLRTSSKRIALISYIANPLPGQIRGPLENAAKANDENDAAAAAAEFCVVLLVLASDIVMARSPGSFPSVLSSAHRLGLKVSASSPHIAGFKPTD